MHADASETPIGLVRDAKPLYEGEAVSLLGRFLFRYEGGYSAWREFRSSRQGSISTRAAG